MTEINTDTTREDGRAREADPYISEDTILAVKKGARFLDAHYPAWEGQINLSTLDLASSNWCILGQLEGGYAVAKHRYGLDGEETVEMGFDLNPVTCDGNCDHQRQWNELTNAWKGLINKRRGQSC